MQDGEEEAVSLGQSGQLIRFKMQICRRNASSSFNSKNSTHWAFVWRQRD